MPTGKLIILNGGSSAGKTSLGRAMQDLLPDCHMLFGIDFGLHVIADDVVWKRDWLVDMVRFATLRARLVQHLLPSAQPFTPPAPHPWTR